MPGEMIYSKMTLFENSLLLQRQSQRDPLFKLSKLPKAPAV